MLRWLTAGESHGPALVATLEGLPAGVQTGGGRIADQLARRRLGAGRGARMKFEQDRVEVLGGLRHGVTQGGPLAVVVHNSEWPKWTEVMAPEATDAEGRRYDEPGRIDAQARNAPLTRPRPGHADLAGMQKYGFTDARPVLERASARETASRVALGTFARDFLHQALGVTVLSHVVRLGPVAVPDAAAVPGADQAGAIDRDEVRCADAETSQRMLEEIDACRKAGDTLGGVIEVVAHGLPPGLGSHVHGDRRLDSRLAGALMGIQAVKGVELGDGFAVAARRGSQAQDEIESQHGALRRTTSRSGGTEGGMSTGEALRVRVAMKPISTIPRALRTVDVSTGEAAVAINQRSDVCAVPAMGVVAEAMVCLVLADAALEKFGGDSLAETRRNALAYLAELEQRGLRSGPGTGTTRLESDEPTGADAASTGVDRPIQDGQSGPAGRGDLQPLGREA